MKEVTFNPDLKFGVATASTQIEGGDTNNTWYRWTKDGNKTKDHTTSFRANSHWENYKAHIDLMSDMGLEIYRMSLEWSRIEPDNGIFSDENMDHYIDEINYLKSKGIEVLVTLHHFSNPLWFEDLGGFKRNDAYKYFLRYTRYVCNKLKGIVTDFCTINEPNVYASNCFFLGEWLNEEKSLTSTLNVLRNMATCHIRAYTLIHELIPDSKVGIALNVTRFSPLRRDNMMDKLGTYSYDRAFNMCITYAMGYGKYILPLGLKKGTGEYFDYFGINYYTTNSTKAFTLTTDDKLHKNDLGWDITPWGFREVIKRFHEIFPNKDIYITENGTSDKEDKFRAKYIYDHLRVFSDLSYVKRYYHWTFMDNFEWKEGESACFGLVKYNYKDATYEVRNSGRFYSEIIEKRKITEDMLSRYGIGE